jgi:hypothetical protein
VCVASVWLLVAGATPTAAQIRQWSDATGDMWHYGGSVPTLVPATVTHGDIQWVIAEHRLRAVVVTVKYVDLESGDGRNWELSSDLLTNERKWYTVIAYPTDSSSASAAVQLLDPGDRDVSECGVTARVDYELNYVKYRIPRPCISRPRWIRMTFFSTISGNIVDPGRGPSPEAGGSFTRRIYRG